MMGTGTKVETDFELLPTHKGKTKVLVINYRQSRNTSAAEESIFTMVALACECGGREGVERVRETEKERERDR